MASKQPRSRIIALLSISTVCSVVSLAALFIHPQGTGTWRTGLNIISLLCVIVTIALLGPGSGRDGHRNVSHRRSEVPTRDRRVVGLEPDIPLDELAT